MSETQQDKVIAFLERRIADETEHAHELAQAFAALPTDRVNAWDNSETDLRNSLKAIENIKQLITRLS